MTLTEDNPTEKLQYQEDSPFEHAGTPLNSKLLIEFLQEGKFLVSI